MTDILWHDIVSYSMIFFTILAVGVYFYIWFLLFKPVAIVMVIAWLWGYFDKK